VNVGLIGHGAVGREVAERLRAGSVDGAVLSGILTRSGDSSSDAVSDIDELIERADLVIEAAGHDAVRSYGPILLRADVDLLIISTGALADKKTFEALEKSGPGRLLICPGAIGGIDLLRAVRRSGPVMSVRLTSRKHPRSLVQPWMTDAERAQLLSMSATDPEYVLFEGAAREAALRFPQNANVAATVALAAMDWHAVQVHIVADAALSKTEHILDITGQCGQYHLEIRNEPAPENPATSGLVAPAVLRCVEDLCGAGSPWML
jgi:aspartate dehydrogenase